MRSVKRAAALKVLWDTVRGQRRPGTPGVAERLVAFPRMVLASVRGEYDGLDVRRMAMMGLAVVYVLSPVDLVPEALLFLAGFTDDTLVLAWLAGALLSDTEAFLAWEERGAWEERRASEERGERVVQGTVVG